MGKNPKNIKKNIVMMRKLLQVQNLENLLKVKGLNCIELKAIQHLQRLLSGLLKVNYSKELRVMKRIKRQVYNGQTT